MGGNAQEKNSHTTYRVRDIFFEISHEEDMLALAAAACCLSIAFSLALWSCGLSFGNEGLRQKSIRALTHDAFVAMYVWSNVPDLPSSR